MTKMMADMTEPELKTYFNLVMEATEAITPPDVMGSMVIMFMDNGITQYASSIERDGAIKALRELADRLEQNQTVTR